MRVYICVQNRIPRAHDHTAGTWSYRRRMIIPQAHGHTTDTWHHLFHPQGATSLRAVVASAESSRRCTGSTACNHTQIYMHLYTHAHIMHAYIHECAHIHAYIHTHRWFAHVAYVHRLNKNPQRTSKSKGRQQNVLRAWRCNLPNPKPQSQNCNLLLCLFHLFRTQIILDPPPMDIL